MTQQTKGRAWCFGDNIDTDLLAPGPYMKSSLAELASHCLEAIRPEFAGEITTGDVVIGGTGFGIGSSREQAAQALVELGVSAVIARSFARIFYRNALNLGLPVLVCEQAGEIADGDSISVDAEQGLVTNHTQGTSYQCEPIPVELMVIVNAGGLMPYLKQKFSAENGANTE